MRIWTVRNLAEFAILGLVWWGETGIEGIAWIPARALVWMIILVALAKGCYFGIENLQQLWQASRCNLHYHRYMLLVMVNMSQIIISYALDYECLHRVNPFSFGGLPAKLSGGERLFEYFYFSVLTFTFFGYGDVTPQSIPAKFMTITEVVLAFITVIFLLSDFMSLKDSLARTQRTTRE